MAMKNSLRRKFVDILYLMRDVIRITSGRDYFHLTEKLGNYFNDGCSYYSDFTGKVNWKGTYIDNVPALYIPSIDKNILFPSMILQYGLGCIDMYFITRDRSFLSKVSNVYVWIIHNIEIDGYLSNRFKELDSHSNYYSDNSAMTEGLALSFLVRVVQHGLIQLDFVDATEMMRKIFQNMVLPLEKGGTAIYKGGDTYFCEYCRTDEYVVLNGWIFAIFGLHDYQRYFKDGASEGYLNGTLDTLEKVIINYILKDKWSYYDNKGRISSVTYQTLHIHLMDALYRLTNRIVFRNMYRDLKKGNNYINVFKYTFLKVIDKLKDEWKYATVK